MSDYSNTFGGAAKDAANSTILGADHETEYDAVATMSATKANKTGAPATTNNLAMLTATGDLADSLVESDGSGNITANVTGNVTGNVTSTGSNSLHTLTVTNSLTIPANSIDSAEITADAVGSSEIAAGAVDTSELATSAVTGIKLNAMTAGTEIISKYYGSTITAVAAFPTESKMVECRAGQSGTVRVFRTHDGSTMYTAVYINGVSQETAVTGSGQKTTNVTVVEGDLIQIYGNCSTNGCTGDTLSDIMIGVANGIGIVGEWYV